MIRIAAVGDVHYGPERRDRFRSQLEELGGLADILFVAGDLTQSGEPREALAFAQDFSGLGVPVVVVLGNHEYHLGKEKEIAKILTDYGLHFLDGESINFSFAGTSVGVAGVKGFGGGFSNASLAEFGEQEIKTFARKGQAEADHLRLALDSLKADYLFALLHYAPIEATLRGEPKMIYPFLGSYLLAEAIDISDSSEKIHCVFHGHAHRGVEKGRTPGGIPVRNVALTVIRKIFKIYTFD